MYSDTLEVTAEQKKTFQCIAFFTISINIQFFLLDDTQPFYNYVST